MLVRIDLETFVEMATGLKALGDGNLVTAKAISHASKHALAGEQAPSEDWQSIVDALSTVQELIDRQQDLLRAALDASQQEDEEAHGPRRDA